MGKKSSKTTNKTVYGNTTTTNPYVTSQTNNSRTATSFNQGSAFDSINKFVNKLMPHIICGIFIFYFIIHNKSDIICKKE